MQAEAGTPLTDLPRRRPLVVLGAAACWVALDQATKVWAESTLERGESVPVVGELLQWHLTYNSGAAFSLGTGWTGVVTAVATLVSIAIVWQSLRTRSLAWGLTLGLLLGGALGNLVDRYFRPPSVGLGHVVDFIRLPNFPVFNVADIGVTTAAGLIIVLSLRGIHPDGTREGADQASDREVSS